MYICPYIVFSFVCSNLQGLFWSRLICMMKANGKNIHFVSKDIYSSMCCYPWKFSEYKHPAQRKYWSPAYRHWGWTTLFVHIVHLQINFHHHSFLPVEDTVMLCSSKVVVKSPKFIQNIIWSFCSYSHPLVLPIKKS